MGEKMITGILIDTKKKAAAVATVKNDFQEFYRILNCDLVEITARRIIPGSNRVFNIIADEEGLCKNADISALSSDESDGLVGNLFIVGEMRGYGGLTELTEDEQKAILNQCRIRSTRMHPEGLMILHHCDPIDIE